MKTAAAPDCAAAGSGFCRRAAQRMKKALSCQKIQ